MPDELICPHCGQRMRYNFQQGKLMCEPCDYSPLDAKIEKKRARGPREYPRITHRGTITPNALAAFRTGHDHLHNDQPDKAREAFHRAVYFQHDFADAHIWLAELAADEQTKRDHLGKVLAFDNTNPEALRRLMILNGRLTPEQAAQTNHHNEPLIKRAESPVSTETQVLLCPVCSGNLTVNEDTGRVECRFCGHTMPALAGQQANGDLLSAALLERRASPVRWVIGERLLHCKECGAERTIPVRKLSQECPFCGSTHVIMQDALKSFEQPSALVPFRITRRDAGDRIRQALDGFVQRVVNIFDPNRVRRANLDGVYLPFWVFDATAEITVTRVYKGSSRSGVFAQRHALSTERFTDAMYDVSVPAVTSPPRDLIARMGRFDLDAAVPYQAKLLARYPAELYSIDFDKASLEARSIVSRAMREKHGGRRETGDQQMEITTFSNVGQMSFRLLLLPVWVATLFEVDGDVRPALINGQTGKVVLGQAKKVRA